MTHSDDSALSQKLAHLPQPTQALLKQHRFDEAWLLDQARRSKSGTRSNFVQGALAAPHPDSVMDVEALSPEQQQRFGALGEQALRDGSCALVVLAGGMATRMGGVTKALVEVFDQKTFLDLRLKEQHSHTVKYGKCPPLWLMTSHATHDGIAEALGSKVDGAQLALFRQSLSVRLDSTFDLFLDETGEPSVHSPGHGDLPDSLKSSGLLSRFVAAGGKYVLVTNLDNLGGGLDPVLIGMHLSHDAPVSCEVVDKVGSDRGGIPIEVDGQLVVLEEFRIPTSFDPSVVRVFNVNSFAFDASALDTLEMDWTYFEVVKKVGDRSVIQYERLINEVTSHLTTKYIRVPRQGVSSRFMPVKDFDELADRRNDLIALAAARGMI
jgi:UTP--glucose-1-phosphate uridylyltransferase